MKKALIVGINSYKDSPLRGCVNDAKSMNTLLSQQGFSNIKMLINQQATTAGIKKGLDWLTTGLKPNDVIVFHFSGHGSQVRDKSKDEADRLDECLIPIDNNWRDKIILDDHLAYYFKRIPKGARAYIVLDCCHSGTGTRGASAEYRKSRFMPAPSIGCEGGSCTKKIGQLADMYKGESVETKRWMWPFCYLQNLFGSKQQKTKAVNINHALVSGCKSNQTSADAYIKGRYRGALSYYLVKTIKENPDKNLAEVHAKAKSAILRAGYSQESQLEAPASLMIRKIFS